MADRNQNAPEAQRRSPGRLSPLRQGVVLAPKKQVHKVGLTQGIRRLKMPMNQRVSPVKTSMQSESKVMSPGRLPVARRLSPVKFPVKMASPRRMSPGKVRASPKPQGPSMEGELRRMSPGKLPVAKLPVSKMSVAKMPVAKSIASPSKQQQQNIQGMLRRLASPGRVSLSPRRMKMIKKKSKSVSN